MGLGKKARFVKASRPGFPPVPTPPTRGQRIKQRFQRGLDRIREIRKESERKQLSRAHEQIARDEVLLKRDKLRAGRAEATRRMVRAGGGTFKERVQFGKGDMLGGFGGPPQQRRPRQSRPKKKRSRRNRAPPKQRNQMDRLLWG